MYYSRIPPEYLAVAEDLPPSLQHCRLQGSSVAARQLRLKVLETRTSKKKEFPLKNPHHDGYLLLL